MRSWRSRRLSRATRSLLSFGQARRVRGASGQPLNAVFRSLEERGTQFVRGELVLIASAPGIGKSIFTLTEVMKSQATTFYQSCDSDAFTQLTRGVAIATNCPIERAKETVLSGELGAAGKALAESPVRFNFRASPSVDDLILSLDGYLEVYGAYPEIVVVDNITNLRTDNDDGDPFSGLEGLLDFLHDVARETQACVIGLHHVTGPYNDGDKPIPLSGLKNQVGRVPEVVLTLHRRMGDSWATDRLCVSTVKNRNGSADPSGNTYVELEFKGDYVRITDPANGR
jgi:hypothetical protein